MEYLTAEEVLAIIEQRIKYGNYFCSYCLTPLEDNGEGLYYCPNEMCLFDTEQEIETEKEANRK